jgi:hypothetical protein
MAALGLRALWGRTRGRRAPEAPWPQTSGTVISSTVQVSARAGHRDEHPLVYYAYQVAGIVYQGSRIRRSGNGLPAVSSVDRYPAGAAVVVYYDPMNPGQSALEL